MMMALMAQSEAYYPRAFVVSELDKENDEVICVDGVEFKWSFKEIEDWERGDLVVAIMSDNGTPNYLFDDYFVEIRYGGFTFADGNWKSLW